MIRNFFTLVVIVCLGCFSLYNYWQVLQLRQTNGTLQAANAQLKREIGKRHGFRVEHDHALIVAQPKDPVQDAQSRISKAEAALTKGNIGDAIAECKMAGSDIQSASNSTSSSVRSNVGNLKAKLDSVQQQASGLLHKLGA